MKKVKITLTNPKTPSELRSENERLVCENIRLRSERDEASKLNSDLIDTIVVLNERIIKSEAENVRKNNALVEVRDSLNETLVELDETIEQLEENIGERGINPVIFGDCILDDCDCCVDDDGDICRDGACDCCKDDESDSSDEEEEIQIEGIGNTDTLTVCDMQIVTYNGREYQVHIHEGDTPETVIAWFDALSNEERCAYEEYANSEGLTLDEVKNISITAVLKSGKYN